VSSGFNTDVRVGEQVFHVQTEDRGPSHPVIDTAIYQQGRVLHRRTTSYAHLTLSVEFSDATLRERVEQQHRGVIEELRSGALSAEIAAAAEKAARPGGIRIELRNPKSWLSAGNISLDVEILSRADNKPQSGVLVEAAVEGALRDRQHTATTDDQGRARIHFPLPPLGKGDLALVIRAQTDLANDEIRFSMRSRQKEPPPDAAQLS
jgi:hypothetical protein